MHINTQHVQTHAHTLAHTRTYKHTHKLDSAVISSLKYDVNSFLTITRKFLVTKETLLYVVGQLLF